MTGDASPCTRRAPDSTEIVAVPCNERLAGDWGGTVTESSATEPTGYSYRAEISIKPEGNGTIAYPKFKCVGTLDYKMRRGDTYVYLETITEGTECGDTGDVELTAVSTDGSAFDFHWVSGKLTVTGRLTSAMIAGATKTSGTTSKPVEGDDDECLKYLPNRGAMVPMPCSSETAPVN